MPVTAPSIPPGSRRAICTGRAICRPTTTRSRRAWDSAWRWTRDEFLGREALLKIKAEGVTRRLASFTIEGFAPLHGGEAIVHEGQVVASTTSAGYGHTLGQSIAFGYLPDRLWPGETEFAIEAFGKSYPARRGARCLYDPNMERFRS